MTIIDQSGAPAAPKSLDVHDKVAAMERLDPESQARAVTAMLSHSRTGLLAAITAQDLPGIVEFKAKASAIHEMTKQLRLGRDMQTDAAEFLRRAERGLGVAIREGQERGEVSGGSHGGDRHSSTPSGLEKKSPFDLAKRGELYGGSPGGPRDGALGIYAMTDNVTPDAFEDAITEARDEGNLSRANVARKCKARATEVAPGITGEELDELNVTTKTRERNYIGRAHAKRQVRALDNAAPQLAGIASALESVFPGGFEKTLTPELAEQHYREITNSLTRIKSVINTLKEAM